MLLWPWVWPSSSAPGTAALAFRSGGGGSGAAVSAQNAQNGSAPAPPAKADVSAGSDAGPQGAPSGNVDAFEQGTKPPPLIARNPKPTSPYAAKLQKAFLSVFLSPNNVLGPLWGVVRT